MNTTEAIVEFRKLRKDIDIAYKVDGIVEYLEERKPDNMTLHFIMLTLSWCIRLKSYDINLVEAFKVLHAYYTADKLTGVFVTGYMSNKVEWYFKEFYRVYSKEGV